MKKIINTTLIMILLGGLTLLLAMNWHATGNQLIRLVGLGCNVGTIISGVYTLKLLSKTVKA